MASPMKDDIDEPALVSEERMEDNSEAREREELSSDEKNSGMHKRKRSDEDEEDDENLIDTAATADSAVASVATPPEDVDKINEDETAENLGNDDNLNASPGPSTGIAKKSTAKGYKPGPLSKKLKEALPQTDTVDPTAQPVSYIALMPINQPGTSNSNNATSNPILAVPVQQNIAGTSFISFPPGTVADPALSSDVTNNMPIEIAESQETATSEDSNSLRDTTSRNKVDDESRTPLITNEVDKPTEKPARFKKGKPKVPYRHAQPVQKKKAEKRSRNTVSDFNSSDDEGDEGDGSKMLGSEMVSLFYKQFGDTKPQGSKSLMDKLHRSIFQEESSESEEEEEMESEDATVLTGKTPFKVVNCPGAGKYEAFVGPLNNSKLSIIRCQEFTQVKNFWYEVYKVRVLSSGREANTNILIPVPEGYKVYVPSKGQEVPMQFSHTAHEDYASKNRIDPKFLEKLANTELKLRKYKDEVKVLRTRYIDLLKEYANRPQFSTVSDLVGASSKFLTEDQLVFFLMQLKSGAHNMQGIRYSVREKVLALSIYQKSPEVYKWLRKLLNLPSKSVLDRWLEDVGCQDPQLLKKLMYHVYANYNFKRNVF